MDAEKIYDIYWEGPFKWEEVEKHVQDCHVLYQIYGAHHLYGRDVLLYIGSTARLLGERLKEHEWWVDEEYDRATIRLGSIGEFTTWEDWEEDGNYEKADTELVQRVEALLIYAHQPAYNSRSKSSVAMAEGIRIFNSGRLGQLFPEVSYKYFWGK